MIYNIYSIKDSLVNRFSDILYFPNEAVAVRYFDTLCKESKISKDLQLFCLGTYNLDTGDLTSKVEFIKAGE